MKPIYIDMDGVLTDFVSNVLESFDSDLRPDQIDRWNMEEILGVSLEEFWDVINSEGEDFWGEYMQPYPWTAELLGTVREFGKPVLLTSPARSPYACAGKLHWIQRHLGRDFTDWIFTNHKEHVAKPGAILIDDSDKNLAAWAAAGGTPICFPQFWNRQASLRRSGLHLTYVRTRLLGELQC